MNIIGKKICKNKKGYPEDLAKDIVFKALATRDVLLRYYKCRYCDLWHVTNQSIADYNNKLAMYGANEKIKADVNITPNYEITVKNDSITLQDLGQEYAIVHRSTKRRCKKGRCEKA